MAAHFFTANYSYRCGLLGGQLIDDALALNFDFWTCPSCETVSPWVALPLIHFTTYFDFNKFSIIPLFTS